MPMVKSLSDFNRNQTSFIADLEKTQQPIYLTRNGSASIVVMDASAFDRAMSFRSNVYENEMRVYEGLMKGYADYLEGNTVAAADAEAEIMHEKGWR